MKTIVSSDFYDKEADNANKLVDFYEGNQMQYLINLMDGKSVGGKRYNWKSRGFVPRVRNITKAIVDKRVPLFDHAPKLEVWQDGATEPVVPEVLQDILYKADWVEFFNNVDHYASLLKSVVVLQQKYIASEKTTVGGIYRYDNEEDALMLSLLHRGNCVVKMDKTNTVIKEIGWVTVPKSGPTCVWEYTVLTEEGLYDVIVDEQGTDAEKEDIIRIGDNVDGIIPATFFYDTGKPRAGVWHKVPEDLPSFQEMYNLMLTDTEFAIAHQKQKTLFTTGQIQDTSSNASVASIPTAPIGHTDSGAIYDQLPGLQPVSNLGGLGQVVNVNPDINGAQPMVEFKGPESDLDKLNEISEALVSAIASDWSVNIKVQKGSIVANSGFQLVVEEMPNMVLRTKRMASFQAAMCRFYGSLSVLYPELTQGELTIIFPPAPLPVNIKEEDELWDARIKGNRASLLDYFMEVKGLTDEQARDKIDEVLTINSMVAARQMVDTDPEEDDVTPTNPDPMVKEGEGKGEDEQATEE